MVVDPNREGGRATGLSRLTHVYLSRLVTYELADLPAPSGRLIRPLPLFRWTPASALGLGAGVTTEPDGRGANRRGRIAQLAEDAAELLGTWEAVVVTEPAYSRASRYQTLIPILAADEFEAAELDILVRSPSWLDSPTGTGGDRLIAVSLVATVFEARSISRYSDSVIDVLTMRRVDEALRTHFSIEHK